MNDGVPILLKFDDAAQMLFEDWLTDLEKRIREEDTAPAIQAHLGKYRSLMPSLALLFAIADGNAERVPIVHAKLACDWCSYLETHARRVYATQVKPDHRAAIVLSGRLANGWKSSEGLFTLRDVYRSGWTGLDSHDSARRALQVLEEYGWVRRELLGDLKAAGRPTELYSRNPQIKVSHAGK